MGTRHHASMRSHPIAHGVGILGILRVFRVVGAHKALVLEKRNLVVNQGLAAPSRFLGGNVGSPTVGGVGFSSLDDLAVTTMKLGNHPSPNAPAVTDTVGIQQLVYTPTLAVTYPDAYTVQFQGAIPATDGNGLTITEEALYMRNGLLFARTIFSMPKTSSYALLFTHSFSFSRA